MMGRWGLLHRRILRVRQPFSAAWRRIMTDMLYSRWRGLSVRQRAVLAAALLGVLFAAALLWTEEGGVPARAVHPAAAASPPPEIAGLAAAAQRPVLRNPFTAVHETAARPPSPILPAPPPAEPPAAPAPQAAPPAAAAAPRLLRGTAAAADGTRIAVLAQGDTGAVLAVGETWRGYTLTALTETSATLRTPSGTITLTRE